MLNPSWRPIIAHEPLGLFDTPARRREIRFAIGVVSLLGAGYFLTLPVDDVPLAPVVPFVPVVDAVVAVGELMIATLLYAQAAMFRSRALALLASGFVSGPLLILAHALTFPGAFAPHGLLGAGLSSAAWIMIFRRLSFPLVIMAYAIIKRREWATEFDSNRPRARVLAWVAGAIVLALAAILLATKGHTLLPPMFVDDVAASYGNLTVFNLCNIAVVIAAAVVLLMERPTVLDIWLMISLAGWLIQSVLNLPLHARFTLGWYGLFLIVLVAHMFVLLALIGESGRMYARLALSTAARDREREARMMTMDAVAATISHEVGQPLAAVNLSASACLNSLTRVPPDYDTAIQSLRDTIEGGNRVFDVLKSVRSTYNRDSGSLSEFELNELILDTVSLLGREVSAQRISLQLSLGKNLPSVLANRVQIQRVLSNLLTNAIEAIDASRRRSRRITIRSTRADGDSLLVEVSDTGTGISARDMERIFEPFYTTKATGTGLGLSLCSTIVEEHGGRLWATSGSFGSTFHMQLRRNPIAQEEYLRSA